MGFNDHLKLKIMMTIFIREKIMGGEERIENLEAYFFRCYRYKAMTEMRNENRYVHPEDDFFIDSARRRQSHTFGA